MDLGLSGKRALVLAASRGLGLGIAKALAAEGCQVLICGRTEEKLKANVEEMRAAGGKADYVVADIADAHFADQMIHAVHDKLGGIDILINNTGGPTPGMAEEMDADKLYTFFQSMVVRVITLTNALVPLMKTQGFGRIVTVASSGVFEPIQNLALSNTLRGALVGWNKTLATEVASYGVTANMLLPGSIHTDRIDELQAANAKRTGKPIEEIRENALKSIPTGRLGRVEEFGATAAFLCSVQASYITGSMIRVDGGAAKSL
ncbi:SDR family oxidoreductase [Ciceribacter sp. L1K22]|uniref:SDR family oxidoreductase n=1 Tax=Ciceribacter sp. L1K22 TaxID=2820275 RepID=UPI001ABEA03A|nr:SDR family oxidoreductase [Ciceribacter sp. L1K22]MBO3759532.1 SDR family oxidoreductase [Ciceribacter sp. L1K22]